MLCSSSEEFLDIIQMKQRNWLWWIVVPAEQGNLHGATKVALFSCSEIRHTHYANWKRNLSHSSLLPDSFGFFGGAGPSQPLRPLWVVSNSLTWFQPSFVLLRMWDEAEWELAVPAVINCRIWLTSFWTVLHLSLSGEPSLGTPSIFGLVQKLGPGLTVGFSQNFSAFHLTDEAEYYHHFLVIVISSIWGWSCFNCYLPTVE